MSTESGSVVDIRAFGAVRQLDKFKALLLAQKLEHFPPAGELIDALSALVGGSEGESQARVFMANIALGFLMLFDQDVRKLADSSSGDDRDNAIVVGEAVKVVMDWLARHPA